MRIKLQPSSILLITTLSLALNLHALTADSFWGDEILTASFANTSPAEVIRWTASDIHPPLYYLIVGAFTKLIIPLGIDMFPNHTSDWLWRFPSAVAGVLAVAITYRLAQYISRCMPQATPNTKKLAQLIAPSASLLLCLAPMAIKYGQEVRMHGLFMLLAALSTWFFFRAMSRAQSPTRWLAYALSITASIYTMYFGFLILTAHAGLLLCSMGGYSSSKLNNQSSRITHHVASIKGFGLATVLTFLLYIPWWPVLFNILRKRAAVGAIEGGVGSPVAFIFGVVQALGPSPLPVAWGFLLLFIIGLIFLGRHHWPIAVFGGAWLIFPAALPIILGDPRALQFRYAFVLPVYLTIIAYGVVNLGDVKGWSRFPLLQRGRQAHRDGNENENVILSEERAKNLQGRWHWRLFAIAQSDISQPIFKGDQDLSRVIYFVWLLATLSFLATLGIYNQTKPNWREAAAYLNDHVAPADLILIGPLWDEGRFIGYYYRGQAQFLTPAAMVTNIGQQTARLRNGGGQVWAVNRFVPAESHTLKNIAFSGVVISEPQLTVYEAPLLIEAAITLAKQAVEAAYPWAAESEIQGVLDPDPRTAQAAALRALGDTLVAAGRPAEALEPYQIAVDIFPGWINGFIALAEAHEMVGNMPAAAEAYRQAVAFNLKWQGPEANEAVDLIEAGQWLNALEKYHQIIGD